MAKKRKKTFEEVFTEAGFIPEWMEQGRVQVRERTARNLFARNMPIEDIVQVIELPIEKVRAIVI